MDMERKRLNTVYRVHRVVDQISLGYHQVGKISFTLRMRTPAKEAKDFYFNDYRQQIHKT